MSSSRHPFHFLRIVDVIHCFVFRLLEKAAAGAAARSQKELNIDGTNSGVLLWLATNEMNTLF